MPLVPLGSSTTGTPVRVVGGELMLKLRIQPLASPLVHPVPTDTKRRSVPPTPMLGLKNSVKGEHGLLLVCESTNSWFVPVPPTDVFMAEPVKPVSHNAGVPLPATPSEPHT